MRYTKNNNYQNNQHHLKKKKSTGKTEEGGRSRVSHNGSHNRARSQVDILLAIKTYPSRYALTKSPLNSRGGRKYVNKLQYLKMYMLKDLFLCEVAVRQDLSILYASRWMELSGRCYRM